MNISKLLSIIVDSKHCYSNIRDKFLQMMTSNYEVIYMEPLEITGRYSLYEQDADTNMKADILVKDSSIFIYDESAHSGNWMIQEVKSIEEAEKFILHPGGYLNVFCSSMIIINCNIIKPFKVFEELNNGMKSYVTDMDDCIDILKVKVEWI